MAKVESSIPISVVHNNLKGLNDGNYIHLTISEKERLDNLTSDKNYIHSQDVASDTWTVLHNLNKYASVTIVDSGNSVVIGDVEYINANELIIRFQAVFSGKAYIN